MSIQSPSLWKKSSKTQVISSC